jgi:hypothetical protein
MFRRWTASSQIWFNPVVGVTMTFSARGIGDLVQQGGALEVFQLDVGNRFEQRGGAARKIARFADQHPWPPSSRRVPLGSWSIE